MLTATFTKTDQVMLKSTKDPKRNDLMKLIAEVQHMCNSDKQARWIIVAVCPDIKEQEPIISKPGG